MIKKRIASSRACVKVRLCIVSSLRVRAGNAYKFLRRCAKEKGQKIKRVPEKESINEFIHIAGGRKIHA